MNSVAHEEGKRRNLMIKSSVSILVNRYTNKRNACAQVQTLCKARRKCKRSLWQARLFTDGRDFGHNPTQILPFEENFIYAD
jgi:hypothetical protein